MDDVYVLMLRLALISVAATHLTMGVLAIISPPKRQADKMLKVFYGATLDLTPQERHLIRMLGAYMIAVAFVSAFAVADPVARWAIVYGTGILLLLRGGQRIVFAREIRAAFGIFPTRMKMQTAFFLLLGALIVALRLAVG